jgi:hypothetical protein
VKRGIPLCGPDHLTIPVEKKRQGNAPDDWPCARLERRQVRASGVSGAFLRTRQNAPDPLAGRFMDTHYHA